MMDISGKPPATRAKTDGESEKTAESEFDTPSDRVMVCYEAHIMDAPGLHSILEKPQHSLNEKLLIMAASNGIEVIADRANAGDPVPCLACEARHHDGMGVDMLVVVFEPHNGADDDPWMAGALCADCATQDLEVIMPAVGHLVARMVGGDLVSSETISELAAMTPQGHA